MRFKNLKEAVKRELGINKELMESPKISENAKAVYVGGYYAFKLVDALLEDVNMPEELPFGKYINKGAVLNEFSKVTKDKLDAKTAFTVYGLKDHISKITTSFEVIE